MNVISAKKSITTSPYHVPSSFRRIATSVCLRSGRVSRAVVRIGVLVWVEDNGEERDGDERTDGDEEEEEDGTSSGRESGIVGGCWGYCGRVRHASCGVWGAGSFYAGRGPSADTEMRSRTTSAMPPSLSTMPLGAHLRQVSALL